MPVSDNGKLRKSPVRNFLSDSMRIDEDRSSNRSQKIHPESGSLISEVDAPGSRSSSVSPSKTTDPMSAGQIELAVKADEKVSWIKPHAIDREKSTQEKQVSDILDEFSDFVSASGLPRAFSKNSRLPVRIFYGFIFVCSFAGGMYFGILLIQEYLTYPTNTLLKVKTDTNLQFPAVTVCNSNKWRIGGIKETRDPDLIYLVDEKGFGSTYYPPCLNGDFNCSNVCLRTFRVCDGVRDCPNHKDEVGCDYGACGEFQYKCKGGGPGGYCIKQNQLCDGTEDCYDGSDEDDCGEVCNGFQCGGAAGVCIPPDLECNGKTDCGDGSDEANCENLVGNCYGDASWACANVTECIYPEWVCDKKFDCTDESDEANCGGITALPPNQCNEDEFRCSNGECIWNAFVCDARDDCTDGSDENAVTCEANKDGTGGVVGRLTREELLDGNWYEQYFHIVDDVTAFEIFVERYKQAYNAGFERVEDTLPIDWSGFVSFSANSDFSDLSNVAILDKKRIKGLGHQSKDFIMQCTFDSMLCDDRSFYTFQDDVYGNCFTFNHPSINNDSLTSSSPGPNHGLKLTLFTEQKDYISIFGQENGAVVSIHSRDVQPFPEESGIRASTGRATSIGLKQTVVSRQSSPYGNCTRETESKLSGGYTLASCKKECLQNYLSKECGCVDTILIEDITKCNVLNQTQERCRNLMYYLHNNNKLPCSEDCREPCDEILYSRSTSSSSWPSDIYMDYLIRTIHSLNAKTRDINDEATLKKNLARVEVYFEELTYQEIIEEIKYEGAWDLMSQIGGVIGLYIGLSIITIVEFGELFILLMKYFFAKCSLWLANWKRK